MNIIKTVYAENALKDVIDANVGSPRFSDFEGLLAIIANTMIGAGISISVVFMIYSGIKFMAARSDPRELDTAKSALTYSVIAFGLAAFSVVIKDIIFNTAGVTL